MFQLNVKSAVLNGFLEGIIYVEKPEGFSVKGHEDEVYQLKKNVVWTKAPVLGTAGLMSIWCNWF